MDTTRREFISRTLTSGMLIALTGSAAGRALAADIIPTSDYVAGTKDL
jgi:hypothetical protein